MGCSVVAQQPRVEIRDRRFVGTTFEDDDDVRVPTIEVVGVSDCAQLLGGAPPRDSVRDFERRGECDV